MSGKPSADNEDAQKFEILAAKEKEIQEFTKKFEVEKTDYEQ